MNFVSGITFCLVSICLIENLEAANFSVSDSLYTFLTSGRNKNLRPHTDTSQGTVISIDFNIVNLQEINEVEGTVSLTGYFTLKWKDDNLNWTPSDYGNIYHMILPQNTIWIPSLMNSNSAKDYSLFGLSGSYITVLNDGTVLWYPGQSLHFTCSIDATFFPFDTQKCTLDVISWGYGPTEVLFNATASSSVVHTSTFTTNSEWELEKTSVWIDPGYTGIRIASFKFYFKRRPVFLLATLIMPLIFMALLNITVFLLPQESGERIGFAITLLLTVVVYLTIAQELLPATAVPRLSSICIILMFDLLMSGLILISIIVSSRIYYKPEEEDIPNWIKKIVSFQSKVCLSNSNNQVRDIDEQQLVKNCTTDNEKKAISSKRNDKDMTWQDIAKFWDKMSFICYFVMFLGGNMFYFLDIFVGTT